MALGDSLAFTPSWAVASVTALLVILSLLLEASLHLLSHFVDERKRKTLNQSLDQLKSGLRNMGFITLLLTVANEPVSKICIPTSYASSFLPCMDDQTPLKALLEVKNTCSEGNVPLLSPNGTQQLQMLVMMLAVFHLACSLVTLGLLEIKMKKWELWERETKTLDHKLCFDSRRFMLAKETAFGRRHLKFWSNSNILLWIVCLQRQFTGSVSKADYFALRRGFINAHLGTNNTYNFQKFLRRTVDKDFKEVVTISLPLWTYVVFFLFFSAEDFHSSLWLPIIPFVVLLVIGAKLETIITQMCLLGSKHMVIISGEVSVNPNDKLFWLGKPHLLLYAIQFIAIENSFQIAFIIWDMYTFGYPSCFHRGTQQSVISIALSLLVQFLCAYVTLPLYALVSQMGSSMKESILADQVVAGLKRWHAMAKRNLSPNETAISIASSPSARAASSSSAMKQMRSPRAGFSSSTAYPPLPSPRGIIKSSSDQISSSRAFEFPTEWRQLEEIQKVANEKMTKTGAGLSSSSASPPLPSPGGNRSSSDEQISSPRGFEFPTEWRELEEIPKVTNEMMNISRSNTVGEVSFRMWWTQEVASPIDGHSSSPRGRYV